MTSLNNYPILHFINKTFQKYDSGNITGYIKWMDTIIENPLCPFKDANDLDNIMRGRIHRTHPSFGDDIHNLLYTFGEHILRGLTFKPTLNTQLWEELLSIQKYENSNYITESLYRYTAKQPLLLSEATYLHEHMRARYTQMSLQPFIQTILDPFIHPNLSIDQIKDVVTCFSQQVVPMTYGHRKNNPIYRLMYQYREQPVIIATIIPHVDPLHYLFPEESGNIFRLRPHMMQAIPEHYKKHVKTAGFIGNLRNVARTKEWVDTLWTELDASLYRQYCVAQKHIDIQELPFIDSFQHAYCAIQDLGVDLYTYFHSQQQEQEQSETVLYL